MDDQEEESSEASSVVPTVNDREVSFEHRTELLKSDQMKDGSALTKLLDEGSKEGWELLQVISLDKGYLVLLRRLKRNSASPKRVGFAWPAS